MTRIIPAPISVAPVCIQRHQQSSWVIYPTQALQCYLDLLQHQFQLIFFILHPHKIQESVLFFVAIYAMAGIY